MFFGVAIPAIVVGVIAWFYLKDKPTDAKWLTPEEQAWLTEANAAERKVTEKSEKHVSVRYAFGSGRVWMLSFIYFGFIYGLYALAFFLPTIIDGFQDADRHRRSTCSRRASSRRSRTCPPPSRCTSGRVTPRGAACAPGTSPVPAVLGAVSIPLALFAGSPAATIAVDHPDGHGDLLRAAELLDAADEVPHRHRRRRGRRAHQHGRQPGGLQRPVRHRRGARLDGGYEVPMMIVGGGSCWSRRS